MTEANRAKRASLARAPSGSGRHDVLEGAGDVVLTNRHSAGGAPRTLSPTDVAWSASARVTTGRLRARARSSIPVPRPTVSSGAAPVRAVAGRRARSWS